MKTHDENYTRDTLYTLSKYTPTNNNLFFKLPIEIIEQIAEFSQAPNNNIAQALKYAAYAQFNDRRNLLNMLDENPSILLRSGNVTTPGGDKLKNVTIYEFLLGAGDYILAEEVQVYFSKITDGAQEKIRQYERYRPHIEGIITQDPYDLTTIIELIKDAPDAEITDLLNNNMERGGALRDAIMRFREYWAPKTLTEPCMHYNYASLQHAFDIFYQNYDKLIRDKWISRYDRFYKDRINLVWLLISFEMRRLPGYDRCVVTFGNSVNYSNSILVTNGYRENFFWKANGGVFPNCPSGEPDDFGMGSTFGEQFIRNAFGTDSDPREMPIGSSEPYNWSIAMKRFIINKKAKLIELMPPPSVAVTYIDWTMI